MKPGDDVMVKDGCFLPLSPMNGKRYTRFELECRVDGFLDWYELEKKWLVVDASAKTKGKLINRIATGWIRTEGMDGYICGTALLINKERWEPE